MSTSLETARLALAVFTSADAEELHAIFSDPATHTIGDGPFTSLQQTQRWIARRAERYADLGLAWYGLRFRGTGVLVGNTGLFIGRTGSEPEIGCEVTASLQGRGLATEAASAVVAEADRTGWPRLWATVRPGNAASLTVLARLGFVEDDVRDDDGRPLVHLRRGG